MKAQKGSKEVQLCSFFNFRNKWKWVVYATPKPLYPKERDLVLFEQLAGWAPGLVWTGVENHAF